MSNLGRSTLEFRTLLSSVSGTIGRVKASSAAVQATAMQTQLLALNASIEAARENVEDTLNPLCSGP